MSDNGDPPDAHEGSRQDFAFRERRQEYLMRIAHLLNVNIDEIVKGNATGIPFEETADLMRLWMMIDDKAKRRWLLTEARRLAGETGPVQTS